MHSCMKAFALVNHVMCWSLTKWAVASTPVKNKFWDFEVKNCKLDFVT
jgi:hypothetical protein